MGVGLVWAGSVRPPVQGGLVVEGVGGVRQGRLAMSPVQGDTVRVSEGSVQVGFTVLSLCEGSAGSGGSGLV